MLPFSKFLCEINILAIFEKSLALFSCSADSSKTKVSKSSSSSSSLSHYGTALFAGRLGRNLTVRLSRKFVKAKGTY